MLIDNVPRPTFIGIRLYAGYCKFLSNIAGHFANSLAVILSLAGFSSLHIKFEIERYYGLGEERRKTKTLKPEHPLFFAL